jgi:hypothetical protein
LTARSLKLGNDKILNAPTGFIADRTHGIESSSSRVIKLPIEIALARSKGTGVTTEE